MKANKYEYLLVVQGYYATTYGWEDLSEYPQTPEGRKAANHDLRECLMNGEPHRIIRRRVLAEVAP